jgi:selenocysteine-specific elongation factor
VSTRHFVIATAGHVDHGKSALVKALTGTDPDRLPEEKAREITIELGFTHFDLISENGQDLCLGIVDVPGHEDFVRNMIAGVGSIDLALFVVAADDGWMPQTEEHLQILNYLGVTRAVVALTKSDLGHVAKAAEEIRARLQSTPLLKSPIIATSAHSGAGIADLKRTLAAELSAAPSQPNLEKPRLFVDRAFALHGIGTVVTGTLTGGMLKRGETVVVQPRNLEARIRSIQSYGRDVDIAQPGMRTAINLPDLAVGTSERGVGRGDVITTERLAASITLDVLLLRSGRAGEQDPGARSLKSGATIDVHHGTKRVPATIVLLDRASLKEGEQAIAQLRLASPLFAFLGDRFVLRDRSQQQTLAGGVVLDPDADRQRFRSQEQRTFLTARAGAWHDVKVCAASEIERAGAFTLSDLLPKSQFAAADIAASLSQLETRGDITIRGKIGATTAHWRELRQRAAKLIDDIHAQNPERSGLDLNALRAAFRSQAPEVFEALLSDLCTNGFVRTGQIIARDSHQPALPNNLEKVARNILNALSEKPDQPPPPKRLAPDQITRETLRFLIEQGTVTEISPELVLLREDFERMKSTITDFIARHGPATVSEIRRALQTSRRVIVPLLERLDRDGLTRRVGDRRILAH